MKESPQSGDIDDPDALRQSTLQTTATIRAVQRRTEKVLLDAKRALELKAQELTASLSLLNATIESTPDAITAADLSGKVVVYNSKFVDLWKIPQVLLNGRDDSAFNTHIAAQIDNAELFWKRISEQRTDPARSALDTFSLVDGRILERHGSPQYIDGRCVGIVVNWRDVTADKHSEELIWRQANFDTLTGLPNWRNLHARLDQELKQARRAHQRFAVLFVDLDNFKEVNDAFGHSVGDTLLHDAARRLETCVRETDVVARLGGDEFTVLLREIDDTEAVERVTDAIIRSLREPFDLGKEVAYVSASIGVALYPDDADSPDELLKNADQAMYAAKHHGRNRAHYFTASMQAEANARIRLIADLRTALARDEFRLHFQPIVALEDGCIRKAEALLRWQHPVRGLIGPGEFIPVAEDIGLIVALGEWVLREAVRHARRWQAIHAATFQISVNVSPVQIVDQTRKSPVWIDILQASGLPRGSIGIEITERMLLNADPAIKARLQELRDAGIDISLDDFGTGYSSLAYLQMFAIDSLKIDQVFVRNMETRPENVALCRAIISMAHELGLSVIAEGIETAAELAHLVSAGCDLGQGHFFAKALPPEEFTTYLLHQRDKQRTP